MTDVQRYMMKLAAVSDVLGRAKSAITSTSGRVRDFVGGLGDGKIEKSELKNIEGQLKEVRSRTEQEKKVERLTGRRWTPRQYARGAAIGAGFGTVGHLAGSLIEGAGKPGRMRELLAPRKLARTMIIASLYGAAVPAARRVADVEAAKRGKF